MEITLVPPFLTDFLRRYAPEHLSNLSDLHLRFAQGLTHLRNLVTDTDIPDMFDRYHGKAPKRCKNPAPRSDPVLRAQRRLLEASDRSEVLDLYDQDKFGLKCEHCIKEASTCFGGHVEWYREYTYDYSLSDNQRELPEAE